MHSSAAACRDQRLARLALVAAAEVAVLDTSNTMSDSANCKPFANRQDNTSAKEASRRRSKSDRPA